MPNKRPFPFQPVIMLTTLCAVLIGGWVWQEPLLALWKIIQNQTAVSAFLRSYGWSGPLVLAGAQLIQVFVAVIPGHVLLIAAGYVYGFGGGFLLNLTFTVGASQLAFALARRYGQPFVYRLASPHLVARWQRISATQSFTFFTISFILPLFPTDIMNFIAGLSPISPRAFFAANLLGRLPGVIMLTLIGSHGLQLPTSVWVSLTILTFALIVLGRMVISRYENNRTLAASEKG